MKHTSKISYIGVRGRQRGQGMTEYIIITALIAIAAIGAVMYFGQTARSQVAGMAQELSGNNASSQISAAKSAADNSNGQATANKTLKSYNGNGN
ncbi:MAG: pilus assembly protein [Halothiobacillus sp.]